jgi:glycerol kinase
MPDAVLALDQGTTGSTALVFTHDGSVLGRAYAEIAQSYPQPGWVEQDPREIWETSQRVMREAIADAGLGPGEVKALGITNQRETTVIWDRATGVPVHPAIVWQSRQSAPQCDALNHAGHAPLLRARTGLVVDPYFSGSKIRWILERYPETVSRARDGALLFGTIDTWLIWQLTGGASHVTDPTNASRTLLYNIHTREWDPVLLETLDIPAAMLPEVRPSAGLFGEACVEPVSGVPITGVAGDQQAALYGQGCWEPGMAKNTYGTGAFLVANLGQQRPDPQGGLLTTIACDRHGQPAYAVEGSVFVAGALIQWFRDELGLLETAAASEAIATEVDSTAGVYIVPAFTGLGAPYWDMHARGAILGLTRGADRRHLVRAALEAIAYQTADVVTAMGADGTVPVHELRVDGGACANDFLMQFQADVLGVTVDRPRVIETTATGAAFLAGLGAGFWSAPDEVAGVRQCERRFEPQLDSGTRASLLAGWKDAVARVRSSS